MINHTDGWRAFVQPYLGPGAFEIDCEYLHIPAQMS